MNSEFDPLLELCLKHSDDLIIILSDKLIIKEINTAVKKLLGWNREEVYDQPIESILNEYSMQSFIESNNLQKIAKMTTHVLANNQDLEITWNIIPIIDKNLIFVAGKYKREFSKKQTEFLQFENLVRYAPGFVYWKDKNSVYQGCNDEFANFAGVESRKQVIGKTDFDLIWKEAAPYYVEIDQKVIKSGKAILNHEEEIAVSNNKVITAITNKVPLFDNDNNIIGLLGITTDITKQKKTEEALKIAKEAAESADKAKSEFIANMSHDIRTPLTGILGLIQELIDMADNKQTYLQQSSKDKEVTIKDKYLSLSNQLKQLIELVQEDGQLLIESADELLQLLNEILETMRLESGKAPEESESFDLRDLIQHNIELMEPVARHKQLKLIFEIDEQIPKYFAGLRSYFDRTLLNLLSNALKFTKKGHVKLKITRLEDKKVSYCAGDKIILIISVEDTGIGIPSDKFATIFDHFSRLTPSYQGLYKGAGLGLYTVKRYAEAMGAEISLESDLEKGTCFTIKLPLIVSDHSDREKLSYQRPKRETPAASNLSDSDQDTKENAYLSILIVEDNFIAAKAVKANLKLWSNCHIDVVDNGQQAIEKVQKANYDLILMDIGLPDIDGIEVAKQIRALNHENSTVPIVALTGHGSDGEIRDKALAAGMQEVFTKPLQMQKLELVLKQYLHHSSEQHSSLKQKSHSGNGQNTIIDWEGCVLNMNGDKDCVRELLTILSTDLKITKEKIAKAYAVQDSQTLRDELHKARGGVVYLVLPELEKALTQFHDAVKDKSPDEQLLEKTYGQLQKAMKNFWGAYRKLPS